MVRDPISLVHEVTSLLIFRLTILHNIVHVRAKSVNGTQASVIPPGCHALIRSFWYCGHPRVRTIIRIHPVLLTVYGVVYSSWFRIHCQPHLLPFHVQRNCADTNPWAVSKFQRLLSSVPLHSEASSDRKENDDAYACLALLWAHVRTLLATVLMGCEMERCPCKVS
jgi:hypothetical protein